MRKLFFILCFIIASSSKASIMNGTGQGWTGSYNTLWGSPTNWVNGSGYHSVPQSTDIAYISTTSPFTGLKTTIWPIISSVSDATAYDLRISGIPDLNGYGGYITQQTGSKANFNILEIGFPSYPSYPPFAGNGSYTLTGGTLTDSQTTIGSNSLLNNTNGTITTSSFQVSGQYIHNGILNVHTVVANDGIINIKSNTGYNVKDTQLSHWGQIEITAPTFQEARQTIIDEGSKTGSGTLIISDLDLNDNSIFDVVQGQVTFNLTGNPYYIGKNVQLWIEACATVLVTGPYNPFSNITHTNLVDIYCDGNLEISSGANVWCGNIYGDGTTSYVSDTETPEPNSCLMGIGIIILLLRRKK